MAIQTEGMIKDLVKNLSSDNDELQMHCANAIFKVVTEIGCYFKRKYKATLSSCYIHTDKVTNYLLDEMLKTSYLL